MKPAEHSIETTLRYRCFTLENRQIEWLRRTFGHKSMSAGIRAIIDEAMDDGPIAPEPKRRGGQHAPPG